MLVASAPPVRVFPPMGDLERTVAVCACLPARTKMLKHADRNAEAQPRAWAHLLPTNLHVRSPPCSVG